METEYTELTEPTIASFSRRAFLKLSLAISGLLVCIGTYRFLSYHQLSSKPTQLTLNSFTAYLIGSITYVPLLQVYLIRDEFGFYALSTVCTHLGCTVAQAASNFECPCHSSRFDIQGNVLRGPATLPLETVEVSLSSDNRIVIDSSVRIPSNQRLVVNQSDK
jgi:cytochrome b6-f complex iron-sulfur subunit